jgi:hypothetical protein
VFRLVVGPFPCCVTDRYQSDERYKGNPEMDPVRIAQEIVSEFRENLERGETFGNLADENAVAGEVAGGGAGGEEAAGAGEGGEGYGCGGYMALSPSGGDKVMEAARLCVDYCDDHETAVGMLTTAQRWLPAMQLAMRFRRVDLQSEVRTFF